MTYPEKFDWVFNHGAVAYRLNTKPQEAMYYTSHKFKPTEIVIDKSFIDRDWETPNQTFLDRSLS